MFCLLYGILSNGCPIFNIITAFMIIVIRYIYTYLTQRRIVMKKSIIFILISLTLFLSACIQSKEERMWSYIIKNSDFVEKFSVVDFTNQKLNIEVRLSPFYETQNNDSVELNINTQTQFLLDALKTYSEEHKNAIKEVNIYFVSNKSQDMVTEIGISSNTLLKSNWLDLDKYKLSQFVDSYKFNGY